MKRMLALFCCILLSSLAFAHAPVATKMDNCQVKFHFDTGDSMYGSKVMVEDKEGKILYKGFIGKSGVFSYAKWIGKGHKIVVTDGEHEIEFQIPHCCCE